ncbi:hypothetical protein ABIB49_003212 [Arthrobacter sp. UYCu512]|uniref:hypothetical protein n=1 Tax=Arthrobacter sp. UYCu512 TaxID=3156338 RepID=UPI00339525EF
MNSKQPQGPRTGTAPRPQGPENDTAMSLHDQARDIIQAVLTDPDPQNASVKATLRSLLTVHPDDHIAVLRERLILTRGLDRTSGRTSGKMPDSLRN